MNRIILIGNGFDLAHGLPTSYADFIRGYYIIQKLKLLEGESELNDGLCSAKISDSEDLRAMQQFRRLLEDGMFKFTRGCGENTPTKNYDRFFDKISKYESKFFEAINKAIETKNWVDIESEYYSWLKKLYKRDKCEYTSPVLLDKDLEMIKAYLITYLKIVQQKHFQPELKKECIYQTICEPFHINDIAYGNRKEFDEFLTARFEYLTTENEAEIDCFLQQFGQSHLSWRSDIDLYKDSIRDQHKQDALDLSKHIKKVNDNKGDVPGCFLLPDQILLLNFNYTSTADLYVTKGSDFEINHIHGELDNDKNPIIFGYGDELDDDYKEIAKLNDNDYLKNIKSIRYLETDNYRRLLSFIDSAPFQIYIMGHSCGNSDRTLLNTLFEHKNCVSIKPFYYQKDDGSDNYIELIQNISRNFNDMRLMRDRVVNKSYCRPLVPAGC